MAALNLRTVAEPSYQKRRECARLDLGLAMGGMRAAKRTEFLDHELLGLLFLVLAGRIVASFAAIACQAYQISHRTSLLPVSCRLSGSGSVSLWDAIPLVCRDGMPRGRQILQAHDGIRTRDLFLTKEVLYRLSYMGPISSRARAPRPLKGAAR